MTFFLYNPTFSGFHLARDIFTQLVLYNQSLSTRIIVIIKIKN